MCGLVPHHDNLFLNIVFKLQKLSFKKICERDVKIWERAPWGVVGSGGGVMFGRSRRRLAPASSTAEHVHSRFVFFPRWYFKKEEKKKVMGSPNLLTG